MTWEQVTGGKTMQSVHTLRSKTFVCALALATAIGASTAAIAAPITYSATVGHRSASATFDVSGTNLIVTLINDSNDDVLVPVDVLTAVFFDVNGASLALTPVSAVLKAGSSVLFGTTDPGNVVGGEWAYRGDLDPAGTPNRAYGISSVGLGLFGPGDLFPGTNLQGPASPDGLQYGITSLGDNPATGNTPVTGTNALIQNAVVFTLAGLPDSFDPSTRIENVIWQYGTDLSEPRIPEPATLGIFAVGALLLRRRCR
jgi:hypothetical protein